MNKELKFVHEQMSDASKKNIPDFKAGDNVSVSYKIVEGGKERLQVFKGDVIARRGVMYTQTFTVRKISDDIGVERIFPLYSPNIDAITVNKVGNVRRSKLFYLRERSGKRARIKEKVIARVKSN